MERLSLPLATAPAAAPAAHADLRNFATDDRPIRSSAVADFLACPMSVVLQLCEDGGNDAADTGSLVHAAADRFHKTTGALADRVAAAQAALEAARDRFPLGDEKKAVKILGRYTADPENQNAVVLWSEQEVKLYLDPAPEDPTGKPVVVLGHLDQIRLHADGTKRVWDIKTGERLCATDTVTEYVTQQACYLLCARRSLAPDILPGGIIYTPGYAKARSRVFLPIDLTVEQCEILVAPIVHWVALVRQGYPLFRPSVEACKWCPVKPWPKCHEKFEGWYQRRP